MNLKSKSSLSTLSSSLNSILSKILLKDSLIIQRLLNSWDKIVESPFNIGSYPIKLINNRNNPSLKTVVIQCSQAQALYFTMNKENILEAITQYLKYSHICDIRVSITSRKKNDI